MGRNGIRTISETRRKPLINEEVVDQMGKKYVVLAVGLRYVDVNEIEPNPSKIRRLVKISDVANTGVMHVTQ